MPHKTQIRIAILDMYDETVNLGMAGIERIVSEVVGFESYQLFDVRAKAEVPGLDFDIYILSGGPGDPRKTEEPWGSKFYSLLDDLWNFNKTHQSKPKFILNICHSFQMVADHFGVGEITERKTQSFGVFPVHKTEAGHEEWLFEDLEDPFYVADFRFYQLLHPRQDVLDRLGAKILLLEKERPHVPLERAIMGIRYSPTWIGVQFHPEAHPAGMIEHFYKKQIKEKVLKLKGEEKFATMIEDLGDPEKLEQTYQTVIPNFLLNAMREIRNRTRPHNITTRQHVR